MSSKSLTHQLVRSAKTGALIRVDASAPVRMTYVMTMDSHARVERPEIVQVRVSLTDMRTKENAKRRLRQIATSPISTSQREKAERLADKAKRARDSQITAKFSRLPHAA